MDPPGCCIPEFLQQLLFKRVKKNHPKMPTYSNIPIVWNIFHAADILNFSLCKYTSLTKQLLKYKYEHCCLLLDYVYTQ